MDDFKEININELYLNPFTKIGKDWMLITAKNNDKVNTMTASWGGLGFMWGKNVAYTVIRPQRYTKEFIDNSDCFSLCFFNDEHKKALSYLGSVSGRDENKIENSKLSVIEYNNVPLFKESKLMLICKKIYRQELKYTSFIEKEIDNIWYKDKDYHTMYISEITNVFVKKQN